MSVGRELCKRLIDVAEDLREYAALVDQFERTDETMMIYADAIRNARQCESLIDRVLHFEGEALPMLTAGAEVRV